MIQTRCAAIFISLLFFFVWWMRVAKGQSSVEHDVLCRNADNVCRAGRVLSMTRRVLDKVAAAACDRRLSLLLPSHKSALVEPGLPDEPYYNLFSCVCVGQCATCVCVCCLFYSSQSAMYITVRPSKVHADCRR